MESFYATELGQCYCTTFETFFESHAATVYEGQVDLIFTSPPFPLNRKKKYGNLVGDEYIRWLVKFAPMFKRLLRDGGSIVMEMGNAWEPGHPVMSTLALEALLAMKREGQFSLCQQFVWYNPAKLPSPVEWVNIRRIRVKDAFTHLWWMAPSDNPKADNRRVLKDYSESMKDLLRKQAYNSGRRPSEHDIGATSFLANNSGAIPSNVITMANTHSNSDYLTYCRINNLPQHPARMPIQLAEFFIRFLTDKGDLVLDPFGGSNTTGAAAENLGRRWMAVEPKREYVLGSRGRFTMWSSSQQEGLNNDGHVNTETEQ